MQEPEACAALATLEFRMGDFEASIKVQVPLFGSRLVSLMPTPFTEGSSPHARKHQCFPRRTRWQLYVSSLPGLVYADLETSAGPQSDVIAGPGIDRQP